MQRIYIPRTTSTNDELSALIREGEGDGNISLRSDYQESGRGQSGRGWSSEEGKNLCISFLLHPAFLSASSQFLLSKMAALSLCGLLKDLKLLPQIKWPNDILVGKRKVAGILLEHSIHGGVMKHSIIGVGLNVNQQDFPVFPRPATSLMLEGGKEYDPASLALALEERLLKRYLSLEGGERQFLDREYLDHLYGVGELLRYKSGEQEFEGIIRGVDEFGHLRLEHGGEVRSYDMQEIVFLD